MLRFAIGCLGFVILVPIVLICAAYFFVVRPTIEAIQGFSTPLVGVSAPFTPNSGGNLTANQVKRFVNVQNNMRAFLDQDWQNISRSYQDLSQGNLPLNKVTATLTSAGDIVQKSRAEQNKWLKKYDFSADEYRWVRTQTYYALGVGNVQNNLDQLANILQDPARIAQAITSNNLNVLLQPNSNSSNISKNNKTLLASYEKTLIANIPMAFLGL